MGFTQVITLDASANIVNPDSVKPIVNSFTVETMTSQRYLIDRGITSFTGIDLTTLSFIDAQLILASPITTGQLDTYQF